MVYGTYNELSTGANLNQLITRAPHIVGMHGDITANCGYIDMVVIWGDIPPTDDVYWDRIQEQELYHTISNRSHLLYPLFRTTIHVMSYVMSMWCLNHLVPCSIPISGVGKSKSTVTAVSAVWAKRPTPETCKGALSSRALPRTPSCSSKFRNVFSPPKLSLAPGSTSKPMRPSGVLVRMVW